MRYLMLFLFFSLPCIGGAAVSVPISQGKTAIDQQAIPHGFWPKKQHLFGRFIEKISVKGLQKSKALPNGSNGNGSASQGGLVALVGLILWLGTS